MGTAFAAGGVVTAGNVTGAEFEGAGVGTVAADGVVAEAGGK